MRPFLIPSAAVCVLAFVVSACSNDQAVLTPRTGATPTAPASTATPVVTSTPAATATPGPTSTPVATPTPVASAMPHATSTPTVAPTITPAPTTAPTVTPAPTATPVPTSTPAPTATPVATPTPGPTAQPQVIYMAFAYGNSTDANNDVIADYSDNESATVADTTTLVHGSQIVFNNDDVRTAHSASGLGTSGFPGTFTNSSGATASGTTIDGGTTWSTGRVGAGTVSSAFTLGPAGTYYYGCVYHYSSSQMEDIIISQ